MSGSEETRKSARIGKKEDKRNRGQNVEEDENKVKPTSGRVQERRRAIKTKSLAQVTESSPCSVPYTCPDKAGEATHLGNDQVTNHSVHSAPKTNLRNEARVVQDDLVVGGNRPSRYRMPDKNILERAIDLLQLKDVHGFFAYPVDCSKVAGYREKIKQPIDFSTMRAKLADNMYQTLEEFELDMLLLSKNAMHFNPNTSIVYEQARLINQLSNEMLKVLKANPERFNMQFPVTEELPGRKWEPEAPGTSRTAGRRGRPRLNKRSLKSMNQSKRRSCIGDDADETNDEFVDKRATFLSWKNPVDDANEPEPVLTFDNRTKNLVPVFKAAGSYEQSLKQFCQGLGATAQRVAERQLSKLAANNQPLLRQIVSPAPPSQAANPPATVRGNDDRKGKMVIYDDGSRKKSNFPKHGLPLSGTDNNARVGGFMSDARRTYRDESNQFQARGSDKPSATNAPFLSTSTRSPGFLETGSSIGRSDPSPSPFFYPSTYLRPSRVTRIDPTPTNNAMPPYNSSCMQTASSSWYNNSYGLPNTADGIDEEPSTVGSFTTLMSLANDPWSRESIEVSAKLESELQLQPQPQQELSGISSFTELMSLTPSPLSQEELEILGSNPNTMGQQRLAAMTPPREASFRGEELASFVQTPGTSEANFLSQDSWASASTSTPLGQDPYLAQVHYVQQYSLGANFGFRPNMNANMVRQAAPERQPMPPPRQMMFGRGHYDNNNGFWTRWFPN